jgi:hypothetical protein
MENFPQRRENGISTLVGFEDNKEKSYQEFKELFANPQLLEREATKTPEEVKTLDQILEHIPGFIAGYGAENYVPVTPDHLHFFDPLDPEIKDQYEEGILGSHDASNQHVVILKQAGEGSEIVNMSVAIHELMHFNSFHSKYAGEDYSIPRRTGLNITSGSAGEKMYEPEIRYFNQLNEAVTEELARRFLAENFSNIDQIREFFETHNIKAEEVFNYKATLEDGRFDSYSFERRTLWELCEIVSSKDIENYPTSDSVFLVLTKSYFTGRLLPVARLIEKTLGKGAFKHLAYSLGERENF